METKVLKTNIIFDSKNEMLYFHNESLEILLISDIEKDFDLNFEIKLHLKKLWDDGFRGSNTPLFYKFEDKQTKQPLHVYIYFTDVENVTDFTGFNVAQPFKGYFLFDR